MRFVIRTSRLARSLRFNVPFLVLEIAPLSRIRSYRIRVDIRCDIFQLLAEADNSLKESEYSADELVGREASRHSYLAPGSLTTVSIKFVRNDFPIRHCYERGKRDNIDRLLNKSHRTIAKHGIDPTNVERIGSSAPFSAEWSGRAWVGEPIRAVDSACSRVGCPIGCRR
jgi:hypothetical protein